MKGERKKKWKLIGLSFEQVKKIILCAISDDSNSLPKDIVNNKKSTRIPEENRKLDGMEIHWRLQTV